MASSFDRWEKDPFFYAAEEVQESADRMESTYRTWIHAKKDTSGAWKVEELSRDLHTTLGTTKWQLEEFQRAVLSSYNGGLNEDSKDRHLQFIVAMEDQISKIEKSLRESAVSDGKPTLPWVQLDEVERNELESFLSMPSPSEYLNAANSHGKDSQDSRKKLQGHRRTASASANIGEWEIQIPDDGIQQNPPKGQPTLPPRKIPSVSGFLNSMDSISSMKTNSVRKWKAADCHHETDLELLRSPPPTRGIDEFYGKSKDCLGCDDCYDKHLHSWYGAIQRQLRRSQYQVQYSRPVQLAFSIILFICIIILIAVRTVGV